MADVLSNVGVAAQSDFLETKGGRIGNVPERVASPRPRWGAPDHKAYSTFAKCAGESHFFCLCNTHLLLLKYYPPPVRVGTFNNRST